MYGATTNKVFRLDLGENNFQILHAFDSNLDGFPLGPLTISDNTLYGSNVQAGRQGYSDWRKLRSRRGPEDLEESRGRNGDRQYSEARGR
jgi:hypothetical protein